MGAVAISAIGLTRLLAFSPPQTTPSTSPASKSWSDAVSQFLQIIVEPAGPQDDLATSPNVVVTKFHQAQRDDLDTLRIVARGMKTVALREYAGTPLTMASDISADMKDADIPAAVKRRLTPPSDDDEATKRANAVAAKWIATVLAAKGNEPIACVVLWRPTISATSTTKSSESDRQQVDPAVSPLFILLRGELFEGHIRIAQIAYGDPVEMDDDPPTPKGR